ncbi:DDB1- and CUL4-associated factor 4 isoform X2 [Senna tora]|uniref:DDB1- and CUL4-associated factor 4 isoform X2 n=1 Tax=Senna tora TaxID=362788 RepID=A0A834XAT5_9FABA|nr:DDB1- and CUL4-associated factor 4 isoform X2 [Senna tora]
MVLPFQVSHAISCPTPTFVFCAIAFSPLCLFRLKSCQLVLVPAQICRHLKVFFRFTPVSMSLILFTFPYLTMVWVYRVTELPGFYYDAEKNRYFPIKGPIPGSSRSSSAKSGPEKSTSMFTQERSPCRRLRKRTSKLLHARELNGNIINSHRWKCNFKEEFQKIQASQPVVWKYQGTDRIGISALEQMHVDVQTLEGQTKTDVLLLGNWNGSLSFSEVGKAGQYFGGGVKWMPDRVKKYVKGEKDEHVEVPGPVFRPNGATLLMSSSISCIRLGLKRSFHAAENDPNIGHALFTTLGSETSGGSVYIIGLVEPLDLGSGTNMGAASVDLQTGSASWFLRCKSDVFAQQIVNSGNVILCGLRNGAIVTIDVREKREQSRRLITHRIPYQPLDGNVGSSKKEWFKLTGNIYPSHTIKMPSSISSLVSLQFDDQYFLASSLDGSVRLYDQRLLQRGAVQTYEGHRFEDSNEVISGGEDCNLRLWSIKSGELLFEDKFSDTVLSTVCYQKPKYTSNGFISQKGKQYVHDYSLGAWLGSQGGLYYMHW